MNDNTICGQADPTCQNPLRGALNPITQFSGRANPDTDAHVNLPSPCLSRWDEIAHVGEVGCSFFGTNRWTSHD